MEVNKTSWGWQRLHVANMLTIRVHDNFGSFKSSIESCKKFKIKPRLLCSTQVVQGSFSQGNVGMFGETARSQCARNVLFSICLSLIRKIFY